jgi:hypothetical protein
MNCNNAQRLLSAYVDAELSSAEMDRVRRHVLDCDCCRFEEEDLRRLKSILTCTPLVEPPPGFEARLSSRVFAGDSKSEVRPLVETWPLLSGVTLVAAALTLLIVNYVGAPRPAETRSERAMAWSMQRDDASLVGSDPFMSTSTSIPTSYVGK